MTTTPDNLFPKAAVFANAVKSKSENNRALLVPGIIFALTIFIWFFCRIEPEPGEIAMLIRKTGKDLPSGEIIAQQPDQKGIQLEVLPEGRYFRNPYTWDWKISRITEVPAGKLAVVTRLFGKDLPPGQIIAGDGEKGILADILRPGRHRINPYAYRIELADAVTIRAGHVGVTTSLVGKDGLNIKLPDDERNTFLVRTAMKGVLPDVLEPGTYYLNPYMVSVVEVTLQSQRFTLNGADAISFLTMDGFTVTVEGVIECAIDVDHAALLTHRVGEMDDIMQKIVLPRARGFSRIEGSKHPAIDFIVGETRQGFQRDLEDHLRSKSKDWGVEIKSVLVTKINVPDEIASISRNRELAIQEAKKYDQQITQARSEAELAKQEMLAQQNKEKVQADTLRIRAVIGAEQEQAVQVVASKKDLEVAEVRSEAAQAQAEAVLLKAAGERDSIRKQNEAEAAVAGAQVQAFRSGLNYARYLFYQQLAPKIRSVLSTDGKDGLGAVFKAYLSTTDKEAGR